MIAGDEKPSTALRRGKDSSMTRAIYAVAEGKADAVVSSGNTGALMAIAKLALRTLPEIRRPAIASVFPTKQGETIMLDLGANTVCDSDNLVQFAILGAVFAKLVKGLSEPTVGLLNVGTEEMKGHDQVRVASEILKDTDFPGRYYGYIEGNDIPEHPVEIPSRGYKQMIHWKDGEVLVVETYSMNEDLLHFYYEFKERLMSVSLNDNRTFEVEDIMPLQLRFRSRFGEVRSKALQEVGILKKEIAYHVRKDNHVFLRIGDFESGHYALLNPKTYDLSVVHNRIWKPDASWINLKIIFKNYETYRWQTYPKVTEYYWDGQLFKRVTVSSVRTISRLPIKRLNELATELRDKKIATLKYDYAL